jgi:hypothetical protein
MRIVIGGYPNSGKTTLGNLLFLTTGAELKKTDELLNTHGWSELSQAVSKWFDEPGDWIIEGVATPRAIRKWRKANPDKRPPFQYFVYMTRNFEGYRPGQRAMANGADTVMAELWQWLVDNDVIIATFGGTFDV